MFGFKKKSKESIEALDLYEDVVGVSEGKGGNSDDEPVTLVSMPLGGMPDTTADKLMVVAEDAMILSYLIKGGIFPDRFTDSMETALDWISYLDPKVYEILLIVHGMSNFNYSQIKRLAKNEGKVKVFILSDVFLPDIPHFAYDRDLFYSKVTPKNFPKSATPDMGHYEAGEVNLFMQSYLDVYNDNRPTRHLVLRDQEYKSPDSVLVMREDLVKERIVVKTLADTIKA